MATPTRLERIESLRKSLRPAGAPAPPNTTTIVNVSLQPGDPIAKFTFQGTPPTKKYITEVIAATAALQKEARQLSRDRFLPRHPVLKPLYPL